MKESKVSKLLIENCILSICPKITFPIPANNTTLKNMANNKGIPYYMIFLYNINCLLNRSLL